MMGGHDHLPSHPMTPTDWFAAALSEAGWPPERRPGSFWWCPPPPRAVWDKALDVCALADAWWAKADIDDTTVAIIIPASPAA